MRGEDGGVIANIVCATRIVRVRSCGCPLAYGEHSMSNAHRPRPIMRIPAYRKHCICIAHCQRLFTRRTRAVCVDTPGVRSEQTAGACAWYEEEGLERRGYEGEWCEHGTHISRICNGDGLEQRRAEGCP